MSARCVLVAFTTSQAFGSGWCTSSLSDLTFWRNFRLRKCHNLEDDFNFSLKSAWLFQFLTRFSLSPTGC